MCNGNSSCCKKMWTLR